MTYRPTTSEVVIERIKPDKNRVIAGPFEFGIIVVNGEISDVFTEGYRTVPKGTVLGIGRRNEVLAYKTYTPPFDLVFRLQYPNDTLESVGVTLDGPVLTSDGQMVAARMNLSFKVDSDQSENLLLLLGQHSRITASDVANRIKDEILGKVVALDLSQYTASELRGNETLLRQIDQSLHRELSATLAAYGLWLINFHMIFGLTDEEKERIEERKHRERIRAIEREREFRALIEQQPSPSHPPTAPTPSATPQPQPTRRSVQSHSPLQPTAPYRGYEPMTCWVNFDPAAPTNKIHKASCTYTKMFAHLPKVEGGWKEYPTLSAALRAAGRRAGKCGVCKP